MTDSPVAVVTGCSSGLGLALAIALSKAGYRTIATMRDLAKDSALRAAATAAGVELDIRVLDVLDTASVTRCIDGVIADTGRLDVLVNNAGGGFVRTTEQASEEDIRWVLDLNLMGVIRCTKAVLAHMRERRAGHVINIGSIGGLVGQPFNEIYCAAKFAVEGYTESLASYLQPSFGVHFTVVEPAGISSEFARSTMARFGAGGGVLDDEYKPVLARYIDSAQDRLASSESGSTPIYQTPAEVAEVVVSCLGMDPPPVRLRTSEWGERLSRLKTGLDPDGLEMRAKVFGEFLA